jgi:hypothetical protein
MSDGFWLTRLLQEHGIEVHVIDASSVTVSRDQRRGQNSRRKGRGFHSPFCISGQPAIVGETYPSKS